MLRFVLVQVCHPSLPPPSKGPRLPLTFFSLLSPSPHHPIQNRQGKTRLSKFYVPYEDDEKARVRGEVHRLIAPRDQKYQSNFVEVRVQKRTPFCKFARPQGTSTECHYRRGGGRGNAPSREERKNSPGH